MERELEARGVVKNRRGRRAEHARRLAMQLWRVAKLLRDILATYQVLRDAWAEPPPRARRPPPPRANAQPEEGPARRRPKPDGGRASDGHTWSSAAP